MSSRRRQRIRKEPADDSDEDDFERIGSPNRKNVSDKTNGFSSPRFRSPVNTPTSCHDRSKSGAENTSLDESSESDKSSQAPTPSKWSYLLPDYDSSQAENGFDVLWDCSSPNAVKYLRRRRKDDMSIKEFVKNFNDEGVQERALLSPPMQLQLFRASLKQHLQPRPRTGMSRKQRRLLEQKKLTAENNAKQQELCSKFLSAVEKRQALEAEEERAKQRNQSEASVSDQTSTTETSSAKESTEEGKQEKEEEEDDCWEDDDLFEDNSFIIKATQNPYQFLDASSASTSTPKFSCGNNSTLQFRAGSGGNDTPTSRARNSRMRCVNLNAAAHSGDPSHGSNDNSFLNTQNSGVIPPTLVPGGSGGVENRLDTTSGLSPISRFESRKQEFRVITPKRLVNVFARESAVDSGLPTVHSAAVKKDVCRQNQGRSELQVLNDKCKNSESKLSLSSGSKFSGSAGQKLLTKDNTVSQTSSSRSVCPESRFTSRSTFSTNGKNSVNSKDPAVPKSKPIDISKSSKTCQALPKKLRDDFSDDELSDEVLVKLTEQTDTFQSQEIEEFPTQKPGKLAPSAKLTPAKPAYNHFNDFADELDSEILASICEFDSFSESPKTVKKTKSDHLTDSSNKGLNTKVTENGPSDRKQPRLQDKCFLATSIAPKAHAPNFYPSKTNLHSNTKTHNYRHQPPTASLGSVVSMGRPQMSKPESQTIVTRSLAFPSRQDEKPVSSLAGGNTVMERKGVVGRKFVFKPAATSTTTAGSSLVSSAPLMTSQLPATRITPQPARGVGSGAIGAHTPSSTTTGQGTGDDDLMADDALYESQIIAMLDQLESQSTQQAAPQSQMYSSQSKTSPPMCSQEEIEKKRLAAMQRRKLRSKARMKLPT